MTFKEDLELAKKHWVGKNPEKLATPKPSEKEKVGRFLLEIKEILKKDKPLFKKLLEIGIELTRKEERQEKSNFKKLEPYYRKIFKENPLLLF